MKPLKALILGLLLLVPILIFIFISVFGTHHFSLKTYYPMLDDKGAVVLNAVGDTVFQHVPYFELNTLAGETVSQSDLDDQLYVASFFSSSCSYSCQKVFSQLVRVQEAFTNNPQVKLVSIGTKTAPDSLENLQKLADKYTMQSGKWILLTGDENAIHTLADSFHEPYQVDETGVVPSYRLVLVDKDKLIRGVYEGTDPEDVDRLILEINVLLDEYSKR